MLAFDHLVIASKQPKQDQEEFTSTHGLKGVPGGHHSIWGTFNELCYFSNNNYIEWLSLSDRETASNSKNPLIQQFKQTFDQGRFGPFQFALRTTFMDKYITYFKEKGISYHGPFPGERRRPDGSLIKWRMLFPQPFEYVDAPLPFLIEWTGKNEPSNKTDINSSRFLHLSLGISDMEAAQKIFETIYRLAKTTSGPSTASYPLENGELILEIGDHFHTQFDHFSIT
ncbi:VOC family protein [Halobacillus sp. B23F22_1]|uniref:VOC family protein n=1 Tax=Halobacillus sp. B23F22_1 TaxID=3459514 RepID=UPI00373F922F